MKDAAAQCKAMKDAASDEAPWPMANSSSKQISMGMEWGVDVKPRSHKQKDEGGNRCGNLK